jgi:tRNA pseudouridine32 synthase / 23S rRNA pseudouridine746 synthase
MTAIVTPFHTISILFENENLIAVDKPEKLASIPERNQEKVCLLKILNEKLQHRFLTVHRLDKQVSGVILFAKDPQTHRYLNLLFEQRLIQKAYVALVHGTLNDEAGSIDIPLRRFGSGRMGQDTERGKLCRTQYFVRERLSGYTLLQVTPLTGRKHQIRAHFFTIGHPIVGDTLYGDISSKKVFPRLMLHAISLRFKLPDANEICIESMIPDSFVNALNILRT